MKKFKLSVKQFFRGTDILLLLLCIISSAYGILLIISATLSDLDYEGFGISSSARAMIYATVIGIVLCIVISLFNLESIAKLWPIIAVVGFGLMVYTRFFGFAPEGREDAVSWIRIGSTFFQSSELLKICFIITFSVHLKKVGESINRILPFIGLCVHGVIAVGLVSWCGDDGSALVFICIFISMIFFAGLKWYYFAGGGVLTAAGFAAAWHFGIISGYQRERFLAVLYPDEYSQTTSYQQNRAISTIGSGQLTGKGIFSGERTQSGYVPVSRSDMILSVAGEELGLLGTVLIIILIVSICLKIISVATKTQKGISFYICCGVASMIAWQSIINIGMCLRLLPVIGITLPFFSAGGSSGLCVYLGIGLVMSAYRQTAYRKRSLSIY